MDIFKAESLLAIGKKMQYENQFSDVSTSTSATTTKVVETVCLKGSNICLNGGQVN